MYIDLINLTMELPTELVLVICEFSDDKSKLQLLSTTTLYHKLKIYTKFISTVPAEINLPYKSSFNNFWIKQWEYNSNLPETCTDLLIVSDVNINGVSYASRVWMHQWESGVNPKKIILRYAACTRGAPMFVTTTQLNYAIIKDFVEYCAKNKIELAYEITFSDIDWTKQCKYLELSVEIYGNIITRNIANIDIEDIRSGIIYTINGVELAPIKN